jgi:lipopolysaccharide/colanic/teichoic acid biosynthesis glycosyltransferase
VLRRYSLDELPQLLNVIRGEMSLVGPRPLTLEEDRYVPADHVRSFVKPGITGLWQVAAGERGSFDDMMRLDCHYVTTWSLLADLVLLVRTAAAVLRPREAC